MTDENTKTENTEDSTEAVTPNFGLNDLVFTLQIIEACTQRGAFRADELSNIGAAYDRLKAFLVANGAIPGAKTSTDTVEGE